MFPRDAEPGPPAYVASTASKVANNGTVPIPVLEVDCDVPLDASQATAEVVAAV